MYRIHPDFKEFRPVSREMLQEIMDRPVVRAERLRSPVIIDSFTLYRDGESRFLRVRGTEGQEGITPCSERTAYFWPLLEKFLALAVGEDARNLEAILNRIFLADINYKIQGLAYWCCISWIEAAVLDMLARTAQVNVTELLGERVRDEIEIYVASGNRQTTPEEEVDFLQKYVDRTGAEAVKFKVGGRMSRNADSMEGRTEGLLLLARKHFGDDFVIHADGNGSFDAARGIEVGRIAESVGTYFYEEPCPFDDLWDTKAVADALDIPLAFGEQETSLRRFAWIIENNAAQVIQPDLQYTGGFVQCVKVARMADAAGLAVTPHVSPGFSAYLDLLFCGVTPNAGHYHEYKGFGGLERYVPEGLAVRDGRVRIPGGPGLGFDADGLRERCKEKIFEVRQ